MLRYVCMRIGLCTYVRTYVRIYSGTYVCAHMTVQMHTVYAHCMVAQAQASPYKINSCVYIRNYTYILTCMYVCSFAASPLYCILDCRLQLQKKAVM